MEEKSVKLFIFIFFLSKFLESYTIIKDELFFNYII